MESRLTRNALRCGACLDVIESKHRHDYQTCSCGRWSVDGGLDYLKRAFPNDHTFVECEELSTWYPPIQDRGNQLADGRL